MPCSDAGSTTRASHIIKEAIIEPSTIKISAYPVREDNKLSSYRNDLAGDIENQGPIPSWINPADFKCPWMTILNSPDGIKVEARDIFSEGTACTFFVYNTCIRGVCSCTHYIGDRLSCLRPCRFFSEVFLRGDTDPDWEFILRGVIFGFKVINAGCDSAYCKANYSSAKTSNSYSIMNSKLKTELSTEAVTVVQNAPQCTHGIFSIPKSNGVGVRTIIDCSKPYNLSVNNFTDQVCTKFSYKTIDDVMNNIQQGDYLAVVDVSDAYRSVNIHPSDRPLQGICWDFGEGPVYLEDNRLSMGLSSSPYIFSKISDFVTRCAVRESCTYIVNYLDDFAVLARNYVTCAADQLRLIHILRRLGFSISYRKVTSPSQTVRFLGIEISTTDLELRLPHDKIIKLQNVLEVFYCKKKASRRELERLGGLLAHCSKVVKGGRSFTSRIYDAIRVTKKPFYKIRLNASFKLDIDWWRNFASNFNGVRRMLGKHAPFFSIYTDASSKGFGGLHGSDWFTGSIEEKSAALANQVGHHYESYDATIVDGHINVTEMYAVMVAARRWAHQWSNHNIVMITDNTTVRAALNSGTSKNKQIMDWVRQLFWLAADNNFNISSVYVRSADNIICDALSRWSDISSKARIASADSSNRLCCSQIFL